MGGKMGLARSTKADYDFVTPWHALVSIWTMPLQSDVHKGFVFEQAETDSFFLPLCGVKVWDLALMSLVHDKKWRSNTLETQWAFCCFLCCLDRAVFFRVPRYNKGAGHCFGQGWSWHNSPAMVQN